MHRTKTEKRNENKLKEPRRNGHTTTKKCISNFPTTPCLTGNYHADSLRVQIKKISVHQCCLWLSMEKNCHRLSSYIRYQVHSLPRRVQFLFLSILKTGTPCSMHLSNHTQRLQIQQQQTAPTTFSLRQRSSTMTAHSQLPRVGPFKCSPTADSQSTHFIQSSVTAGDSQMGENIVLKMSPPAPSPFHNHSEQMRCTQTLIRVYSAGSPQKNEAGTHQFHYISTTHPPGGGRR